MPEIRVNLGDRSYGIYVGKGVTYRAGDLLDEIGLAGTPIFVVTDENVKNSLPDLVDWYADLPGRRSRIVVLPPGEDTKSFDGFIALMDLLAPFDDGDGVVLVAVGGGVIGDLTGFVASCYKRGVPFVQAPTTLLSQVDASVGGKTAINHSLAKNLIGAFHQPSLVLADTDTLETLPERDLRSGIAEVIKHGVIADKKFFDRIDSTLYQALEQDDVVLEDYVATSCAIKAEVVQADERDSKGRRAILNYGHTFGHAIEIAGDYSYAHGEAVAIGMACAGDLSVRMGLMSETDANRIESVLLKAELPVRADGLEQEKVMAAMRLDKKFIGGANRFVLAEGIGKARLHKNVPEELIGEILRRRVG